MFAFRELQLPDLARAPNQAFPFPANLKPSMATFRMSQSNGIGARSRPGWTDGGRRPETASRLMSKDGLWMAAQT